MLWSEVTKQSGKNVVYSKLTLEQYREVLVGTGIPAAYTLRDTIASALTIATPNR